MYNVQWLMSMLMDCSFGHGEFAVDVSQVSSKFQFSNRKKTIYLGAVPSRFSASMKLKKRFFHRL
jgi:hypothetical protein